MRRHKLATMLPVLLLGLGCSGSIPDYDEDPRAQDDWLDTGEATGSLENPDGVPGVAVDDGTDPTVASGEAAGAGGGDGFDDGRAPGDDAGDPASSAGGASTAGGDTGGGGGGLCAGASDGRRCGSTDRDRCCAGKCVKIDEDADNCGGCGLKCAAGFKCQPVARTDQCALAPETTSGRCTCADGDDALCPGGQICRKATPYANRCTPRDVTQCAAQQTIQWIQDCPNFCAY